MFIHLKSEIKKLKKSDITSRSRFTILSRGPTWSGQAPLSLSPWSAKHARQPWEPRMALRPVCPGLAALALGPVGAGRALLAGRALRAVDAGLA